MLTALINGSAMLLGIMCAVTMASALVTDIEFAYVSEGRDSRIGYAARYWKSSWVVMVIATALLIVVTGLFVSSGLTLTRETLSNGPWVGVAIMYMGALIAFGRAFMTRRSCLKNRP